MLQIEIARIAIFELELFILINPRTEKVGAIIAEVFGIFIIISQMYFILKKCICKMKDIQICAAGALAP